MFFKITKETFLPIKLPGVPERGVHTFSGNSGEKQPYFVLASFAQLLVTSMECICTSKVIRMVFVSISEFISFFIMLTATTAFSEEYYCYCNYYR